MEVRHIQGLILLVCPVRRMGLLLHGNLLDPAYGIETPILQMRYHPFLNPTDLVIAVLLFPNVFILRIPQRSGIEMV